MKITILNRLFIVIVFLASLLTSCYMGQKKGDYPIGPVPFTSVKLNDQFWAPKIRLNQEVTIPIAIEQSTLSGRIRNFEIAGGLASGSFCSEYPFDDSDIYKIIEAASFSLQSNPDPKLEAVLDTLIYKIGLAQEDDGYLFTNRTIDSTHMHPWVGKKRWETDSILSHELYNLGHLYEAAAAHYQATGKRSLLDIAIKSANLVDHDFGPGKLSYYPGHQVIEMGLVKIYRITQDKRYLDLAKFFLDCRGPNGEEYNQAHKKVIDQREGVGHSVRATYMYSGMADVAALYNDESYLTAIRAIWEDIVYRKIYVTGGIGASGGNEGFSEPYHLPNMSAYCETCASIGEIFWNQRMFLKDGDAKYYDVLEKTLYNAMLSGVSLQGDRFFYPNPLESAGQYARSKWFGCACCPPNVARLLPSLPGYFYATTKDELYINLFAENSAQINIGGSTVLVSQRTEFPQNGKIEIGIDPEKSKRFSVKIRIPGWAREEAIPGNLYSYLQPLHTQYSIHINGKAVNAELDKGYAVLQKEWEKGDVISLEFPMDVRIVTADKRIKADKDKIAIQRGPFMYCAEWPDNFDQHVLNLKFSPEAAYTVVHDTMLNGVDLIRTKAVSVKRTVGGKFEYVTDLDAVLIPYYSWANRGAGEMMVWLPTNDSCVKPLPAPTIAFLSKKSSSLESTRILFALSDQYEPENSMDHTYPYLHWWPKNNSLEWVQYDFEKPEKISSSSVYWYDDGPFGGCRIPDNWELLYKKGNAWLPVEILYPYKVTKDSWNKIEFKPLLTNGLRLMVKQNKDFSSGIHEWSVE
jgi:DUF1680 family protein